MRGRGCRGRPQRGSTYILMGASRPARGFARLRTPLPQRLMRAAARASTSGSSPTARSDGRNNINVAAGIAVVIAWRSVWASEPDTGYRLTGGVPARRAPGGVQRILLPFTGQAISRRAFEAAVRLAQAENATLMPAFLARVPRNLPLDSPLPAPAGTGCRCSRRSSRGAAAEGIPVDCGSPADGPTATPCRRLLEQEPSTA